MNPLNIGLSTALLISKAMAKVAMKAMGVLDGAFAQNPLMYVLFYGAFAAVLLHFSLELGRMVLNFVREQNLLIFLSPELVKRGLRAMIFCFLGAGAYGILITKAGEDYPIALIPDQVYVNFGKPFEYFKYDPNYEPTYRIPGVGEDAADEWVSESVALPILQPETMINLAGTAITTASRDLSVFSLVNGTRDDAMKALAAKAADEVLKEMALVPGSQTGTPSNGGNLLTQWFNDAMTGMAMLGNGLVNLGTSLIITFTYFFADVVIARMLWLNVLYVGISYKIALFCLPLALVLAYFESTTGILVQIVKHLLVCAITLKVIAVTTANLLQAEKVREIVATATTNMLANQDPGSVLKSRARLVYAEMAAIQKGAPDPIKYKAMVRSKLAAGGANSIMSASGTAVSYGIPMLSMTILAFMAALIAKVGLVIQDALGGTMTYHKGGA